MAFYNVQGQKLNFGYEWTPKISKVANQKGHFGGGLSINTFYEIGEWCELMSGVGFHYNHIESENMYPGLLFPQDIVGSLANGSNPTEWSTIGNSSKVEKKLLFIGVPVQTRIKLTGQENHMYLRLGCDFWFKIKDWKDDNLDVTNFLALGNVGL